MITLAGKTQVRLGTVLKGITRANKIGLELILKLFNFTVRGEHLGDH